MLKVNYKETLFFVAKCLTISLEDKNRDEIELTLKTTDVNWDDVVKVSTAHLVFPALYCNLQRANFLHYLPQELVSYMEYITNLNRKRNQQIITQAQELNSVLLANNITPIFLKGTGNLLAGLYEDISERMVGDIDFLFSKEDYSKAIKILRVSGYSEIPTIEYYNSRPDLRHYRRLQKENNIAAIEIHSELIKEKHTNEFNYNIVNKDSQVINEITVLSYTNKLNLSIIANKINDNGFYYKTMALRNAYDVFLLSKKTNAKDAVNALDKLEHPLNCFLSACYEIFNNVESLEFNNTKKTLDYLSVFNHQFSNSSRLKRGFWRRFYVISTYLFIKSKIIDIYRNILDKKFRVYLFKRLTDRNWYKSKLVQFGIKK